MSELPQKPPLLHVYCDESRQTASKYMVLGGIAIPASNVPSVNAVIDRWRIARKMNGELKWKKVSKGKYADYESLINSCCWLAAEKRVFCFRSLAVERASINYRKYHKGDWEIGFYKMYYQLLLHSFGSIAAKHGWRMLVHLDKRESSYPLHELHKILNKGIRKAFGVNRDVVVNVQPIESHASNLLQVADILMGAVGYHWDDWHSEPGASTAKVALAKLIAEKVGAQLLNGRCNRPWFQVWPFRFRQAGA
jgi:hypothetical protein